MVEVDLNLLSWVWPIAAQHDKYCACQYMSAMSEADRKINHVHTSDNEVGLLTSCVRPPNVLSTLSVLTKQQQSLLEHAQILAFCGHLHHRPQRLSPGKQ
jgi:hypothetical protein